jgi:hypothetical protein
MAWAAPQEALYFRFQDRPYSANSKKKLKLNWRVVGLLCSPKHQKNRKIAWAASQEALYFRSQAQTFLL